jgi:hypothetical protein
MYSLDTLLNRFKELNPATAWAQLPVEGKKEQKKKKAKKNEKKQSKKGGDNAATLAIPSPADDDSDNDNGEDEQPVVATSSSLTSSHSDKLPSGTLAVTRVKDANLADPSKVPIPPYHTISYMIPFINILIAMLLL